MNPIPEPLLSRYLEKLNDKLSESTTLNMDLRQLAAAIGCRTETTRRLTARRINWCSVVSYNILCDELDGGLLMGFPPPHLPILKGSEREYAKQTLALVLVKLSMETAEEELLDADQWRSLQQLTEAARARFRTLVACAQTILEEGDLDISLTPMGGAVTGSAFFDFLVAAGRSTDDLVKYASLLSEVCDG